jgi:Fic family protein
MNIEITRHEADQLRAILSDALATAERLITHPDASETLVQRSTLIAHVCLSVINKIVHEQTRGNVAREVLNQTITQKFYGEHIVQPRTGLDR